MGAALKFLEDYRQTRVHYFAKRAAIRRSDNEARVSPRNPVASSINLDCQREMYHRIVDWSAMPDFDADTQERMDNGNVAAKAAADDLRAMGYTLVETEGPMQPFRRAGDGKVIYTGRLDFKIDFERRIPVEVKDVNQHVFESVDTFADLERWFWTRKYQCQVLIYCLQNNEPEGLVLLTCQGRKKFLPVILEDHLELAEAALKAGEEVVAAVEKGKPPAFTKDPTACRRCWAFGRICQPPIEEQGAVIFDETGELHQLLQVEEETREAHRKHEAAKKRRNEILKAITADSFAGAKPRDTFFAGICGLFAISIKKLARKGYVVAATEYQQAEIVKAGAAGAKEVA
ncbi:MAG TPA: hypothetical protein VJV75_04540 [Candidatus Polarisedimenticolia bacterium]|nr:hypothetical protein [Candidatus Polarisedimenticolia bacterium]